MIYRMLFVLALISSQALAQRPANPAPTPVPPTKVPVVVVGGMVDEWRDPLDLFGAGTPTLRELTETVRKAAKDPAVAGLVVRFENPGWGMAQAADFADAMADFRESGKPLVSNFDNIDLIAWTAAAQADTVTISPVGSVDLHGVGFTLYYFRDLLEKLGVRADVVNTGRFKNALEPFTHQEMSDGTREQMGALLRDCFDACVDVAMTRRSLDREAAEKLLTEGPYGSDAAVEAGAADRTAYVEDLAEVVTEKTGNGAELDWEYAAKPNPATEPPSLMSLFTGGFGSERRSGGSGSKIAVVYAFGGIVDGRLDRSNPFLREQAIAAEDFIDLLEEAASEPGVVAMVIRIDSPGGSASASDRIWNYIETIREDMPVVASMGNVAASGGYYIAMGADRVLAQRNTITGSIGVIGGKLSLGQTYEKIGVSRQELTIGPNAELFSEERLWTDQERKVLTKLLAEIYDDFATKAAESREMKREDLEKLAGGRVWSGTAAQANGLVDEIGGLERAIEVARELSGRKNATVMEFPKELTLMEFLEEMLSGGMALRAGAAPGRLQMLRAAAEPLGVPRPLIDRLVLLGALMTERPKAMAVSPWVIEIN